MRGSFSGWGYLDDALVGKACFVEGVDIVLTVQGLGGWG